MPRITALDRTQTLDLLLLDLQERLHRDLSEIRRHSTRALNAIASLEAWISRTADLRDDLTQGSIVCAPMIESGARRRSGIAAL